MTEARPRFGCIEAGGTKFVVGIAEAHDAILATTRIPTTTPEETIAATIDWFKANGPVDASGIASFNITHMITDIEHAACRSSWNTQFF